MSLYVKYPSNLYNGPGVAVYATFSAFPASAPAGTLAVASDTDILYEYSVNATAWQPIASNVAYVDALNAPNAIGPLDSQPANADALSLVGGAISTQSADATHPGVVNNTTQTFSGNKTFTGTIGASNLSGTNTGDVTVTAAGSTPSAAGASLSGQALTLQPADATNPGILSTTTQSIGGDKTLTGNIAAANLSGTNTGDVSLAAVGSSPNANAGSLAGQVLNLQPADGTNPGVVTAVAQTIGGNKTFTGTIAASNFSGTSSGTNTGDVTLTAVGSSPSANGASLSGQALTLQPADATHPGVITTGTQTFAGTKNFSTPIPYPSLGSLPVNQVWIVDGTRSDSYTADGSYDRPYKTIMAAVNAIIATGLNSASRPDQIYIIGPGTYSETVALNSTALFSLMICAVVGTLCTAISSTSNNANLATLYINGLNAGSVTLTGATNGTTFLSVDGYLRNSVIGTDVTLTNLGTFLLYDCKVFGDITHVNVVGGALIGGDGMSPGGNFPVTTNNAANKPAGFAGTSVIVEKTLLGVPTVSAGSTLQIREGTRVGYTGGSMSVSGDLIDYGAVYRADITINSGGTWTTRGSTTVGTVTNNGTLTAGSTFQGNATGLTAGALTNSMVSSSAAIANSKLATMAAHTIKGNNTGSSAAPSDLTATQVTAELNAFVGDSGSGGTKGLVPAPAAGDAAAGKVLKADGSWGSAGTTSPLTTKGDLYTYSTVNARLPVGSNGAYLIADSTQATGLNWSTAGTSQLSIPNMTDWNTSLTITPSSGFGTLAGSYFESRRAGDTLYVRGWLTAGTTAASTAYITLPLNIDTAKMTSSTNKQWVGTATPLKATAGDVYNELAIFYDGSTANQIFVTDVQGASAQQFTKRNGSDILASGNAISVEFSVPISGWTANSTTNIIGTSIGGMGAVTYFTSSGTFTTPSTSSTSTVYEYIVQGAGGGGGGSNGTGSGAGGGGAGATAIGTFTGIAASAGITVTIGAGGAGGTGIADGSSGGATTLSLGTAVTCDGGSGGKGGTGSQGNEGGAGGAVSSGSPSIGYTGGGGGAGVGIASSFQISGVGGASYFGGGHKASSGTTSPGNSTAYGAGGTGNAGGASAVGGAGADGIIIIRQLTP